MARQSLFWGKAKGKLGEVVLYRAGGEQRSRTYVKNIRNPKSVGQMAQRIKMASLVGFFNSAKPFLKSSFTNRPIQQTGFNAFVANSLPSAITALPKEYAEAGRSVPLFYAISRGAVAFSSISNVLTSSENEGANVFSGLQFGKSDVIEMVGSGTYTTLSDLEAALNTLFSKDVSFAALPSVFFINVICSVYDDEGFSTEMRQVKVDKSGSSVVCTGDISAFKYNVYPFGYIVTDSTRSFCALAIGVGDEKDAAGNGCYFCGAFISYTDESGKLMTNNANMQLVHDGSNYVNQFKPGGDVYENYLAQLGVGTTDILATR